MNLSSKKFSEISKFVKTKARKLDKSLFTYYFENNSAENVLKDLRKYQNEDDGFGHGLEPDFTTNSSSAIATCVAMQYINKLNIQGNHFIIDQILNYFTNTFSNKYQRWRPVPDDVNKSPHAPWWHIDEKTGMCPIDNNWDNPTVEILGYLHKYDNNFPKKKLKEMTNKAVMRLLGEESIPEHSLYCYQIFYSYADQEVKQSIKSRLFERIRDIVNKDSKDWREKYVPKPLDFVSIPDAPFYNLLNDLVDKNLDFLIKSIENNKAWFPTWSWGQYEKDWEKARMEWTGKITVDNLIILKKFGRIEDKVNI
ncbi:hypothetical protein GF362_06075 [Candidatus Dojkabacteria bacterium]|nr:hypothetical protein [Candidatus Dojkabacteria bacterium]